jgi:hypothetical protein
MSSKDVTPKLLLSFDLDAFLTARLRETTLWLQRILLSAMQTARAAKENKKQNIEMVSVVCIQLIVLQLEVQYVLQKIMI